eukprot:CAMPEP_0180163206 /NCGR_PEP_ID=MMETSP0986-20121125/29670_1 /TAXON_ID=697907 /ORGANISM="non described non described, Strain CCMP2293" /LENGTH=129 /DNA_ID=CAMNT_0022113815 /DNA_START=192 /DNA_END=582 /DNA_ORIENTATION=-
MNGSSDEGGDDPIVRRGEALVDEGEGAVIIALSTVNFSWNESQDRSRFWTGASHTRFSIIEGSRRDRTSNDMNMMAVFGTTRSKCGPSPPYSPRFPSSMAMSLRDCGMLMYRDAAPADSRMRVRTTSWG